MRETERNEAIDILEKACGSGSFVDIEIAALEIAITALRAQSEAERKVDRVREYCKTIKNQMLVDACTLGYHGACREILEILEGAE